MSGILNILIDAVSLATFQGSARPIGRDGLPLDFGTAKLYPETDDGPTRARSPNRRQARNAKL